jgi:hypothetical protein
MGEVIGGTAGAAIVRSALREAIAALPGEFEVGVRVLGHRIAPEDREGSCRDSELLIPFQQGLKSEDLLPIDGLTPRGRTPLAHALAQSAGDFSAVREERAIILITDGADTCDGDPVKVVRELERRGLKVAIHTVGLHLTPAAREQLSEIAAAGGGTFSGVGNLPAMRRGIFKALKLSFPALRSLDISGRGDLDSPFDAGNSLAGAMALPVGREFKKNRVGSGDDPIDFFRFEVRKGEKYHGVVSSLDTPGSLKVTLFEVDGRSRAIAPQPGNIFEFDVLDLKSDAQMTVRVEGELSSEYGIKVTTLVGLP